MQLHEDDICAEQAKLNVLTTPARVVCMERVREYTCVDRATCPLLDNAIRPVHATISYKSSTASSKLSVLASQFLNLARSRWQLEPCGSDLPSRTCPAHADQRPLTGEAKHLNQEKGRESYLRLCISAV